MSSMLLLNDGSYILASSGDGETVECGGSSGAGGGDQYLCQPVGNALQGGTQQLRRVCSARNAADGSACAISPACKYHGSRVETGKNLVKWHMGHACFLAIRVVSMCRTQRSTRHPSNLHCGSGIETDKDGLVKWRTVL